MTPVTPLSVFAASCDATIRRHPATEPVAGVAEGGAIVVEPGPVWQSLDDLMGDTGRTDTSAVVLLAPELHRAGYMPNLIATTSIITPAVPVDGLVEAVVTSMEGTEEWHVRARSEEGDDDEDRTLDLLAGFRLDGSDLALSSLVRARRVGGSTVLHQVHVTTFADQILHHTTALASARIT